MRGSNVNPTLEKQNRFTEICSVIAVVMIALIFVVLSVASIMQTCRIDPANPASEVINFDNDAIPVNLALIVLSALGIIVLLRRNIRLSKVNTRFILFIMAIVTAVIPLIWVNLVQSTATGTAAVLLNTARDAAQDQYSSFSGYPGNYSYYLYYPNELGYVLFAELLYRVFGVDSSDILFQIPNVIALEFVYIGIVMIAERIFDRKAVTNLTAIALTVCLQPMFMTTYTYGMIIGLAFAAWSVYFVIRYMKEDKLLYAGIAVVLISLSVMFRHSYMIILAAICIALILHAIGTKRFLALAAAAVMALCCVGLPKLITLTYSQRSGQALDTQVSHVLSAYEGVSDSYMAPGWYSGMAITTLRDAALTSDGQQLNRTAVKAADQTAWDGIGARLKYLSDSHQLGDFFKKKLLSQFNEPAFESVWISQVRPHDLPEGEQLPGIVKSVYTGGLSKLLDHWFEYYNMIVYVGFTAGMIWMIYRRKASPSAVILPIAVLGNVLYQMLFEGKSQYILPYFILLIPFAMYGLLETSHLLRKKTDFLFRENSEIEG